MLVSVTTGVRELLERTPFPTDRVHGNGDRSGTRSSLRAAVDDRRFGARRTGG
jgi:hypothetical protein